MVSLLSNLAGLVVLIAVLYQFILKDIIFTTLGYGRVLDPLGSFGARCEKVKGLGLEGCEDMWLHKPSGMLYMACSNSLSRVEWLPSIDHLNASGRGTDRIAILDTRASGPISSRLKWLTPVGFTGNSGDGSLNLHGFDVEVLEPSTSADPSGKPVLELLLINHRPPLDPTTGAALDATEVGANSTIELFETVLGETTMRHVKTWADPVIETPNNVAWVGGRNFVFTNDRSQKTGSRRFLDFFIASGSVGYCNSTACAPALPGTSRPPVPYPNGLIAVPSRSRPNTHLVYIPSSITGAIAIYELSQFPPKDQSEELTETLHLGSKIGKLKYISTIQVPHPVDNLSVDSDGAIWAAGFPKLHVWIESSRRPWEVNPPCSAWRIQTLERVKDGAKDGEMEYEFKIEKMLEDDGGVLPGATVVVHDAARGALYFGGAVAPYITICNMKKDI